MLLLPAVPTTPILQFASGREAIEIVLEPGDTVVHLIGSDRSRMISLWTTMVQQGGVEMARSDTRSYAPVQLALPPAGGGPLRVRYEFDGTVLTGARAWGAGADFIFEARVPEDSGCGGATARVTFRGIATALDDALGSRRQVTR